MLTALLLSLISPASATCFEVAPEATCAPEGVELCWREGEAWVCDLAPYQSEIIGVSASFSRALDVEPYYSDCDGGEYCAWGTDSHDNEFCCETEGGALSAIDVRTSELGDTVTLSGSVPLEADPQAVSPTLTFSARLGSGIDSLSGVVGAIVLYDVYGNAGDDTITGGAYGNVLYGGAGSDTLYGGVGADVLDGGGEDDYLVGGLGRDFLVGGPGGDTLDGNEGRDELYGDEGKDTLLGGSQSDLLYGGEGVDTLYGGDGDDRMWGEEGQDTLYGGGGADLLDGGDYADRLSGAAGDDTLRGGGGDDLACGEHGDDRIEAGRGDDVAHGGLGADTVDGGEGNDACDVATDPNCESRATNDVCDF